MPHTLLYGGTFDPIHHGHLIVCRRAREILAADRVLFVPARISPHKIPEQLGASAEHRLAMIRLAIQSVLEFAVDPRELSRPGPSYTIDTLDEIRRQSPAEKITLLIGTDQLPKLHLWHRAAELLAGPVAILPRAGGEDPDWNQIAQHLDPARAADLAQNILPTPRIDISATEIRARLRAGLSIDFLLPSSVAAYIHDHNLYRP